MRHISSFACAALLAGACGDDGGLRPTADAAGADAFSVPEPAEDWTRDILSTRLEVDIATREAVATIALAGSESAGASFEIGDLEIASVSLELAGGRVPLRYEVSEAALHVGVPASPEPASTVSLVIEYRYGLHGNFSGVSSTGYTFTWPYFCGNVFPCKSDPREGLAFELALSGVPEGQEAVFPAEIAEDAPSYMLAWTVGSYTHLDLGATSAGTRVGVWYRPGQEQAASTGTASLRDVFDWLEITLGPYRYGSAVASVAVPWGAGAYGGMEHHPFWHVASAAMSDPVTHAHEAAHGWFGNGVRIACWEDFVLSEGTATYLAARALEAVEGPAAGQAIWDEYGALLASLQNGNESKIAWPRSCGALDILEDGLFGGAPYYKGAFFLRSLEERVSREALDAALALFYEAHGGEAAGMQDLLDTVLTVSGYDATACAQAWLSSEALPEPAACP